MTRLAYATARAALGLLAFAAMHHRMSQVTGQAVALVAAVATALWLLYLTRQEPQR